MSETDVDILVWAKVVNQRPAARVRKKKSWSNDSSAKLKLHLTVYLVQTVFLITGRWPFVIGELLEVVYVCMHSLIRSSFSDCLHMPER